jgi:hypothetical protein
MRPGLRSREAATRIALGRTRAPVPAPSRNRGSAHRLLATRCSFPAWMSRARSPSLRTTAPSASSWPRRSGSTGGISGARLRSAPSWRPSTSSRSGGRRRSRRRCSSPPRLSSHSRTSGRVRSCQESVRRAGRSCPPSRLVSSSFCRLASSSGSSSCPRSHGSPSPGSQFRRRSSRVAEFATRCGVPGASRARTTCTRSARWRRSSSSTSSAAAPCCCSCTGRRTRLCGRRPFSPTSCSRHCSSSAPPFSTSTRRRG